MAFSSEREEQQERRGREEISLTQASELTGREGEQWRGGDSEQRADSGMTEAHKLTTVSWGSSHDYCGQNTQRDTGPGRINQVFYTYRGTNYKAQALCCLKQNSTQKWKLR